MMSRPQKYIEGEALHSQHAKSNNALKLRVAMLVVCVLLVSALVVTYLLFELLKTREMLRNLELKQKTIKADVTERPPEIKPCSTVQPICPEPEVKIITQPCNIIQPTTPQPTEITTITQSYTTIPTTTPQLPDITMNDPCYECEDGWKQHGENCYFFSTRISSWDASRTVCRTQGGDLVKIDSSEEQNFLRTTIQQIRRYFWIGLTDSAEEGRWLWVDGSPLNERLTFWFFHEPDDWTEEDSDGEDCARMGPMYWFDKSCKAHGRSICEKPAAAVCPHFSSGTTVRVEDTMSYFYKANAANI
ncbi:C-type lectin domain family 4 member M-like isoform X1 [Simochromis diagramma]|uniref:C-type lectin domain family 4 member M-like isoform X1 n=1 Tax=Simochromis diagramma TaxID=43689 RepID=UPI001A7ECD1F|nr:C-type lectin domain family 4 member M-like isoform X1 [Simochromis diagramma]